MSTDEHKVVITGLGILTTLGQDLATYHQALMAGQSGITHWKNLGDDRCYCKIGGDLSDFVLTEYLAHHGDSYPLPAVTSAKQLLAGLPTLLCVTAMSSFQAFHDAELYKHLVEPERIGHILAGLNVNHEDVYAAAMVQEYRHHADLPVSACEDYGVLSVINNLLQLQGPSFCVGGACASSNMAIVAASDMIRSGDVDIVLVSGACHHLSPLILDAWSIMGALSIQSFNDQPGRASRPFDAKREGFVPSHGAGAIVLESLASAKARNAKIYAELLGASVCMSASRLPKPNLEGGIQTMQQALSDAKLNPDQIDYINAHGTSTPLGDALEVNAIKQVFGEHAYKMPINATKSMLGHCLSSAGATELVATILQLQHNMVHPTINQEEKDPDLDLNFVPNHGVDYKMDVALSNSFGFGGYNATVIVRKY